MAAANFIVITNGQGCALNGTAVATVLITNSVLRAFFPRVVIGCRLSLKIDRNLSPSLAGGLSVTTWRSEFGVNKRYMASGWIFIQICGQGCVDDLCYKGVAPVEPVVHARLEYGVVYSLLAICCPASYWQHWVPWWWSVQASGSCVWQTGYTRPLWSCD